MTDEELLATFWVAGMWFGVDVGHVQEVLLEQELEPVPMAPPGVVGLLNLRGQVLAAVDLRERMGLARRDSGHTVIHYIVDLHGELESLVVDREGPVIATADLRRWPVPDTTPERIADLLDGAYQHDDGLLLMVSLDRVLASNGNQVR